MVRFFYVKCTKMLSFFLIAEVLTGLIYHRPAGENTSFQYSSILAISTGSSRRMRDYSMIRMLKAYENFRKP